MNLGNKILKLRKKKGLSQEELGEKIDVTRQTISNWELGETTPNIEQLKLLSKEFNVSIDELVDNDLQDVLVEKVSNTEKLAGMILKIIKIVLIGVPIALVVLFILAFLFKVAVKSKDTGREIEESIHCKLYGEEHSYSITYQELTGFPIGQGGDAYFSDILDLLKYDDAHQIFNVINDYVKRNGGTCSMIEEKNFENVVNMYVKEGSQTNTGLTLIIENLTDFEVSYGEAFYIEKYNYKNNQWEKLTYINNNIAFNMIGYNVIKGSPRELKQGWEFMYGKLDKGTYRIVKSFSFNSDIPISEDKVYYYSTEFYLD